MACNKPHHYLQQHAIVRFLGPGHRFNGGHPQHEGAVGTRQHHTLGLKDGQQNKAQQVELDKGTCRADHDLVVQTQVEEGGDGDVDAQQCGG
jgi:hypothetical protein